MRAKALGTAHLSLVAARASEALDAPFTSVVLVHWKDPGKLFGREVSADEDNKIKWSVNSTRNKNWGSCQVVHPDTGLLHVKVPAWLRPEVPDHVTLLKQMWEASLPKYTPLEQCRVCGIGNPEEELSGLEANDLIVRTCPLCLLSFHQKCSVVLSEHDAAIKLPVCRHGDSIPGWWNLCRMCIRWATTCQSSV